MYIASALVAVIIAMESGGNTQAVSPAGAVGLMQIMPIAEQDVLQNGPCPLVAPSVAFKQRLSLPSYNVRVGTCYWLLLRRRWRDRAREASLPVDMVVAAAYNGGGRQALRLLRGKRLVPETRQYVREFCRRSSLCLQKEGGGGEIRTNR